MAFASPFDVAARLGRQFTTDEVAQAEVLLDDVEALIRLRISDLDARVLTDDVYAAVLVMVESKAVRRVFLNPGGIRQHSETVDDYTSSNTFDTTISGSDLYVSDDEWSLLGSVTQQSGTISMAGGYP